MHPLHVSSFSPPPLLDPSCYFSFITKFAYQPCHSFYRTSSSSNCIVGIIPHTFFYICIMRSLSILNSSSALLALFRGASALVAQGQLPPTFSSSSFAGSATDYPDLHRDGGGGGVVNGINVVSRYPGTSLSKVEQCRSWVSFLGGANS